MGPDADPQLLGVGLSLSMDEVLCEGAMSLHACVLVITRCHVSAALRVLVLVSVPSSS